MDTTTKTFWPMGSGQFEITLNAAGGLEAREVELSNFSSSGSVITYIDAEALDLNVRLHSESNLVLELSAAFHVSEVTYRGDNIYEVTV